MGRIDLVYITGESSEKLLLKIEDNKAELVDATDFWGLDIPESQELAKERYGVQFATAFFGPGAETAFVGQTLPAIPVVRQVVPALPHHWQNAT